MKEFHLIQMLSFQRNSKLRKSKAMIGIEISNPSFPNLNLDGSFILVE